MQQLVGAAIDHLCKTDTACSWTGAQSWDRRLAAATTLTAIAIDHRLFLVPNPAALLICIVAFAGSLSGLRSAAVTAGIVVVGAALFFLDHRGTPGDRSRGPDPAHWGVRWPRAAAPPPSPV